MHLPLMPLNRQEISGAPQAPSRLSLLKDFGSNPGRLNAWTFVPRPIAAGEAIPLVVVLHGCTQSAAGYDRGSGWSELAAVYGFAVLFPEQQMSNNANLCFNWFEPGDTRRDAGEPLSIAQMVESMIQSHGIDRHRVFITGLSAGGAMTSVMLAIYPNLFTAGAILAGLPHGAAESVQEAFKQMRSPSPSPRTSGASIRRASRHSGLWPAVSIWHGTADSVVSPSNADAIAKQWKEVHGISDAEPHEDLVEGHPRRVWQNADGKVLVEEYRVTGMGHGAPLATNGECGCGEAGAFMLEVGISSTIHSAKSWGLLKRRRRTVQQGEPAARSEAAQTSSAQDRLGSAPILSTNNGITEIIESALRRAGLMK